MGYLCGRRILDAAMNHGTIVIISKAEAGAGLTGSHSGTPATAMSFEASKMKNAGYPRIILDSP